MASGSDSEGLTILLVGHTGDGKSATGNTFLGEDVFESTGSMLSVTKSLLKKDKRRYGKTLEVVDTPGFSGPDQTHQFVIETLFNCLICTLPGFHAIAFVLNSTGRFTDEKRMTAEIFLQAFGDGVDDYAFILLTHCKDEEGKNRFLEESKAFPELQYLLKRVKGKVLFTENVAEQSVREQFAKKMIEEIAAANKIAPHPYYSNENFRKLEEFCKKNQETEVNNSNLQHESWMEIGVELAKKVGIRLLNEVISYGFDKIKGGSNPPSYKPTSLPISRVQSLYQSPLEFKSDFKLEPMASSVKLPFFSNLEKIPNKIKISLDSNPVQSPNLFQIPLASRMGQIPSSFQSPPDLNTGRISVLSQSQPHVNLGHFSSAFQLPTNVNRGQIPSLHQSPLNFNPGLFHGRANDLHFNFKYN